MANDITSAAEVRQALEARGLESGGLRPIGVRPPLGAYLAQLWQRREFIWMDSRHRAATQNAGNRLGNLWLLLRPLFDAAFYYVIFGLILGGHGGVENFAAFVVVGILTFRATASAISGGTAAMHGSKAMVRAFNFPRASIPLAAEMRDGITSVIAVVVMCAVIWAVPPHASPTAMWVMVLPIFVLHSVFNLGIRLFMARIGFLVPDMNQVMSVASRVLMYGSGVIFPIHRFIENPTALAIIELNPLFQIVSIYRLILIDGLMPPLSSWLLVVGAAASFLIVGFVFFWRGEASYGRELR